MEPATWVRIPRHPSGSHQGRRGARVADGLAGIWCPYFGSSLSIWVVGASSPHTRFTPPASRVNSVLPKQLTSSAGSHCSFSLVLASVFSAKYDNQTFAHTCQPHTPVNYFWYQKSTKSLVFLCKQTSTCGLENFFKKKQKDMKGQLIFRVLANTSVCLFRHGETWQKPTKTLWWNSAEHKQMLALVL